MTSEYKPKTFIAVDGEGIDDKYVLLAASTGQYVENLEGLSSVECFKFLLSLPKGKGYVHTGFFFNYDINMMLRDVSTVKLRQLWREGFLSWRNWELEWIPNKSFTVKLDLRKVTIYDCGGFFQTSFVNALRKWEAAPPDDIERIANMKAQRDTFDEAAQKEIRDYCLQECHYLVTLMQKLEAALCETNLVPYRWQGAGSIAGRLLQKERVKLHRVSDDTWGEELHNAILSAYFGGRVELFLQGHVGTVTDYDVNSAYPYAATLVPSLTEGKWKVVEGIPSWGVCHVKWSLPEDTIVCPFPFRTPDGSIYWSPEGEGYYHACEVWEAVQAYGNGVEIVKSWEFETSDDTKPFRFISDSYEKRREYKRTGNPAEKAIKLGLNSLYGKLAQGQGYNDQPPAHRSYLWAGFITAHCRSTMFRLAMHCPEKVVMIATDGIFLMDDPGWNTGKGLGELDKATLDNMFTVQPGVYCDGEYITNKTRGFSTSEVTFDALMQGYEERGPYFSAPFTTRRFQGLGTSLMRKTMEGWRKWPEQERRLKLYPARKWLEHPYNEYASDPDWWKDNYKPFIRHLPMGAYGGVSAPYTPKTPDLATLPPEAADGALDLTEIHDQPDPGEEYLDNA